MTVGPGEEERMSGAVAERAGRGPTGGVTVISAQVQRVCALAVRMCSTMLPSATAMRFIGACSPPRHQVTSPLGARARSAPLGGRAVPYGGPVGPGPALFSYQR